MRLRWNTRKSNADDTAPYGVPRQFPRFQDVALLSFATLRASERLHRVLGPTGMIALTRLMGFLMVCIGVQFIIDGMTAILRDPEFWSGLSRAVATD
jgi:hypothetical protein